MKNSIKKYSKIIMFKKINDIIHQDKKLFKSDSFDFFLCVNDCKGVLTPENIDNFVKARNIEELKELYRLCGLTVYDNNEWNAYDALEIFFSYFSIPDNSDFENLWIRTNCKRIIEDLFQKIKNDDISKDELLVFLERIIKKELNKYSYLSKKVSTYIMKSKEYLKDKIKYIFELNYLINYTEQKQLEIFDNTIHHIYTLFENNNNLNLPLIKELELVFSANNLQKQISKKASELLDENDSYYNQISMLKHFINIFYYDVVVNHKYLEEFVDFYFKFINSTATIIVLKELKANKKQRVMNQIDKYLNDEGTNYKTYFIELKKRLNFYEKNITSSIIELFYKEFVDEELEIEKVLNRLHHNLNLNKNTFLNSKEQISNEMVFDKKVISFLKISLNNF